MRIQQSRWSAEEGWLPGAPSRLDGARLVLAFGSRAALQRADTLDAVRQAYPGAYVTGCSTAGEICGTQVFDDGVVVTAIGLEHTSVQCEAVDLNQIPSSEEAGAALGRRLAAPGLRHVLLLSDGLNVNGSELVRGVTKELPPHVTVTGGLAADGALFKQTLVIADGEPKERCVVAIGLVGDRLRTGYGSLGGWDPFGPERVITRARGNVLYELDGQSALRLYQRYLGEHSRELPASGLLFPLSVRADRSSTGVVRTILSIDSDTDSMTFAGDMTEGSYAQLMRANFDRLIDGAAGAARVSTQALGGDPPALALLISCVGRKMVLKQRVEEEVEASRDVIGKTTVLTGFYSYGEISPFTPSARCELHNQTMTITTLSEASA